MEDKDQCPVCGTRLRALKGVGFCLMHYNGYNRWVREILGPEEHARMTPEERLAGYIAYGLSRAIVEVRA